MILNTRILLTHKDQLSRVFSSAVFLFGFLYPPFAFGQSFGGIDVGPNISFSDFDYMPNPQPKLLENFESVDEFKKFIESDTVPVDPELAKLKEKYRDILANRTLEDPAPSSDIAGPRIFGVIPGDSTPTPATREQTEFQKLFDEVNDEIIKVNIDKGNETPKKKLFDIKELKIDAGLGLSSNPLRISPANGIDHVNFDVNTEVNFLKLKSDEDDPVKFTILKLTGLSRISELFDDVSPIARDLEYHGAFASLARSFNRCWTVAGFLGNDITTYDLGSEWVRTEYRVGMELARSFNVECKSSNFDPSTQVKLRYMRVFSNPSPDNSRHEFVAELYQRVTFNDKWQLEFEPEIEFAPYTDGSSGDFETFRYGAKLSLAYSLDEKVDLKMSAEFGQRNSDNNLLDGRYYKIPLGLSFETEF